MEELQSIWGWQPAMYLFLGGMGAGAFIAAMFVYFRDGKKAQSTVMASIIAAVICLIVGLLLLLTELINPLRGMLMWQSFSNFGSWMVFGAWIVFLAVIAFLLTALCLGERSVAIVSGKQEKFGEFAPKAGRVLGIIGIVLAFCVAVYTGILLMSAPGVPLWDTPLIPCLFTVSALDTGVALVEIISFFCRKKDELNPQTNRILEICVVGLVIVELIVLGILLGTMGSSDIASSPIAATAAQSAALLTQGVLASPFWVLVVAIGLVVPLAAALIGLLGKTKYGLAITVCGAAGALVGGCTLRFLVVMAGLHADPVIGAVAQILGTVS